MEAAFIDLINSEHHDRFGNLDDRLDRRDWVDGFLAEWGLDRILGAADPPIDSLRDLRNLVRAMVEEVADGGAPSEGHVDRLNRAIASVPVVHRLERLGDEWDLRPEPVRRGAEAVVAAVARSAAAFFSEAQLERVKICSNDRCRWVFYDESKNRSRRWCDTSCGNLHKVRRYRERQKEQQA